MVCGSKDCVQEEVNGKCSSSCGDDNHYEHDLKYVCVEKPCPDRVFVSEEDTTPCGSGECYAVESSSGKYECQTKCSSKYLIIFFFFLLINLLFFLAITIMKVIIVNNVMKGNK
jgi:hypothetical protein